jgi:hypothetical protein
MTQWLYCIFFMASRLAFIERFTSWGSKYGLPQLEGSAEEDLLSKIKLVLVFASSMRIAGVERIVFGLNLGNRLEYSREPVIT